MKDYLARRPNFILVKTNTKKFMFFLKIASRMELYGHSHMMMAIEVSDFTLFGSCAGVMDLLG